VAVIRQIEFLWKTVHYPTEPRVAAPRREVRAGLTIRGPHANLRRGPFSHARVPIILSQGALFFSQKVDDLFLVVSVTFRPAYTAYIARSNVNTVW